MLDNKQKLIIYIYSYQTFCLIIDFLKKIIYNVFILLILFLIQKIMLNINISWYVKAIDFLKNIVNDLFMGILYAFIAGIMIQISIYELLPTSFSYQKKKRTILFFIIGFFFMYLSHILL